ncbi:MAG: PhoPQ-activated pathogenicity-related protein [Caulobacteraceae bacterium]|nr:PhoPQ-activated pathogenicity-related protein [Caulobacteraceae bacterium]
MIAFNRRAALITAAVLLASAPVFAAVPRPLATAPTALDHYVAKKDSVYGWKLVNTIKSPGATTYVLDLTSQTWRSEADVQEPVWKHWLTIVVPDNPVPGKGLLYIDGGGRGDAAPTKPSDRQLKLALETGGISAEVHGVPNQPLHFLDEPAKGRSEDDLIAYSRVRNIETKDDTWLVRLAMVKSGVRALDAVQEFLASDAGGKRKVDQFVVSGGSKRGWTAWLVAAVDPRVIAAMPVVIDALNSEAITRHQFEAYGFFGTAVGDYVNHGLFPHAIGTPGYQHVLAIEDPWQYRARPRMKMPKYEINASGDQFFLPDNSQFYYGDLPEEKRIRYVPNARHNLGESDAQESMSAFYYAILHNVPRPRYSWVKRPDGTLVVKPVDKPQAATLWTATNPDARDFRKDVIGNAYKPTPLTLGKDGTYTVRVPNPAKGYSAFFVELTYDIGAKHPIKYTSEVSVVPDVLPHKWSAAAAKYADTKGKR